MKVTVLIVVTLVVAVTAATLAELCFGDGHALPAAVALGLCLPAAVVTLVLADAVARNTPDFGPVAILVGTAMRMTVAVLGVVVLGEALGRVGVGRERFANWVAFLYLITLTIESGLLIRGRNTRAGAAPAGPAKPAGAP